VQLAQLLSSTGEGACTSRSCARLGLGKAITSRIDSVPAIMATILSKPKAMPPWGGAPYWQRVQQESELLPRLLRAD